MIEEAAKRMEAAAAAPMPVACPHCGVVLDPPPKASRKCPECREKLVVRTDPITKEKVVLSPAGAADFDREKVTAAKRRKIMLRLDTLRLGQEDYEATAADLRDQFSVAEPDSGDVFWRLANNLQLQQEQAGQWLEAARTWREMAEHLHDEKRDPSTCLVASVRDELRYHAENTGPGSISDALPFVTIHAHGGCEICGVENRRLMTIPDAQEQLPLPHEDCSKGFCSCSYRSVYPPSADDSDEIPTIHIDLVSPKPTKTSRIKRLFGS
jgi:hypothetical protein